MEDRDKDPEHEEGLPFEAFTRLMEKNAQAREQSVRELMGCIERGSTDFLEAVTRGIEAGVRAVRDMRNE